MSPEGVVSRNVLLRMNNADYREVASESSSHSHGPRLAEPSANVSPPGRSRCL